MLKKVAGVTAAALLTAGVLAAAEPQGAVIVTSSNTADNRLLVYDTAGTLVQEVPTFGQGGASGNAGGIATSNGTVAVANFGSQTVSLFSRGEGGFELRQTIPANSQPVSVAFGKTHLYVLGTTTVESHRLGPDGVEAPADGTAGLLIADGSAAQVGVAGDELIVTEKSGAIERVQLREGAVFGTPVAVALSEGQSNTPFGLTTRGSNAYVTFAGSDTVGVVKNDRQTAFAATGIPGGTGQHAPCWIAVVGPYLFTTNSPSHSVSRLIAGGGNILLDDPVAAQTTGAPIDVAAEGDLLALVETGGGASLLTQFRIDEDGNLTRTVSTPIASVANGIAIVPAR
ncbi:MAG TPA: hypothetical protein VFB99_19020 [Vicinamibacterales bacterium]|nr:hypothetical protein [Vicinamibacterales bacterium]